MMDSIAFKTLRRPKSPNTYLLAPEGLCDRAIPDQISQTLPMSASDLFQTVLDVIEREARWTVQDSHRENGLIHFISTSSLMRYKDDVDVMILPGDDTAIGKGSRLAVYSRSRVGHSDLGANAKRVKYLLSCVTKVQDRA